MENVELLMVIPNDSDPDKISYQLSCLSAFCVFIPKSPEAATLIQRVLGKVTTVLQAHLKHAW